MKEISRRMMLPALGAFVATACSTQPDNAGAIKRHEEAILIQAREIGKLNKDGADLWQREEETRRSLQALGQMVLTHDRIIGEYLKI